MTNKLIQTNRDLSGTISSKYQEPRGRNFAPMVLIENKRRVWVESQARALPLNKPLNESLISSFRE